MDFCKGPLQLAADEVKYIQQEQAELKNKKDFANGRSRLRVTCHSIATFIFYSPKEIHSGTKGVEVHRLLLLVLLMLSDTAEMRLDMVGVLVYNKIVS